MMYIYTSDQCNEALDKIFNQNYKPSINELKIFVKALENTLLQGYVDLLYNFEGILTPEENVYKIYEPIKQFLTSLKQP